MIREKGAWSIPGVLMLVVLVLASIFTLIYAIRSAQADLTTAAIAGFVAFAVVVFCFFGLVVVHPNQGQVVQLFGNYVGTLKQAGFHWVNPFTTRRSVSLRIRNFESAKLKVNDHTGNPIEIAAVVVWRVIETAEAVFEVDDYQHFVHVQSEAALRNLATSYAYDAHVDGEISLRSHTGEVADRLKNEIQDRLAKAGVEVMEARISHLAYAPEIASAMLQRQQASAIIAARTRIVEGAVGMVEMALEQLSAKGIVHLDEERKAAMVSNLLVVLCGDRNPQPIVNTGSLYTG